MIVLALVGISVSCDPDGEEVVYSDGEAIALQHADPYLQVVTGFVPFEIGTPEYPIQFNVINGTRALSQVKLYATYFDAETGESSNEVLMGTYPISSATRSVITDSFTYEELKAGITLPTKGSLPETDEGVYPGSGWSFRFEADQTAGGTLPLAGQINMVLSKYAGIYRVSESTYMRIKVDTDVFPGEGVAHWDGEEVFIGFVDENTLSYNDNWGYFDTPGCKWEFSYDESGKISDIVLTDGIVCASATATLATCESPASFKPLGEYLGLDLCSVSNVIIDNNETGEHVIKLTYGYVGAGGVRQFTETLTKIVE